MSSGRLARSVIFSKLFRFQCCTALATSASPTSKLLYISDSTTVFLMLSYIALPVGDIDMPVICLETRFFHCVGKLTLLRSNFSKPCLNSLNSLSPVFSLSFAAVSASCLILRSFFSRSIFPLLILLSTSSGKSLEPT